ncbi:hypothetical protein HO133_006740 [Letharia lupina]|uniref:Glycosyltransferase family 8 protein n=1 Tax=Letharia lupina TaxID=560253 RepID=A0A8H6F7K1_9LECA|nr:uncharacterized protein HO133_006740 [Letharia lupina]KAF6217638.1 hypothetical protein HO133_006740 [Letharia lupina]
MLSPASQLTSHRILTTSAILAVTFIILLTLYNPRDATAASNGSLVQLSGDKPTSDATISTPGNEQETGKITADNASPSAIAETSAVDVAMSSATAVPNEPRRAFVAFLEAHTGTNRGDEAQGMTTEDEDDYFVATRVLGYQLMHQPETRSNTSIPFIVVASSEVSQSKRARLEKDGAKVVVVDSISDPEWLDTKRQYQGVMTKLRVFQQTEYEKMLYMDADMFIARRLDAIFEDESTRIQRPKKDVDNKNEAAPLPSSFMLAGQAQQTDRVHKYPPDPSLEWMCSGFMVFKPSQAIFEYYTSIMERENSFDPNFPDQNLLNYAHRWDGPMPWTNVYYKWTSTYPSIKEYAMGAAALHEKYWMDVNRVEAEGQNIIGDMWLKVRSDMEAFYREDNG